MTYLFFDTETTGLPDKRLPDGHPDQPHICQLGAILTDSNGKVMAEVNLLVRPDGWTIPATASAIHGITQENATEYGLSARGVLNIFNRLAAKAKRHIAHNIEFDQFMIFREAIGCGYSAKDFGLDGYCTMTAATDIVKCPPTKRMLDVGMTGFKKPNLTEAYRHFFGREFDGAHDAMADVRACRDVFFKLKDLGAVAAPEVAA